MMKTWERKGYEVVEEEFDGDLNVFNVVKNGEVIGTIYPADYDQMLEIITDLDAGHDVNGWEDGRGNTINTNVTFEAYDDLVRDVLKKLAYRDRKIVYDWINDDMIIDTLVDDFNETTQTIDGEITLKEFLDLRIEQEQNKRNFIELERIANEERK